MSRWRSRRDDPSPTRAKVLRAPFAGIPAGARMLVPPPALLDAELRALPRGTVMTVPAFRQRLAAAAGCDATCPVTTGIGLRVVAEVAMEDLAAGVPTDAVAPVWRVLDEGSTTAGRLPDRGALVGRLRAEEAEHGAAAPTYG